MAMNPVFRIFAFVVVLCTALVSVAPVFFVHAQDSTSEIESDISKLNKKLKAAEAEKAALANELNRINSSLTEAQKAIAAAKTRIAAATTDIERKQAEIDLIQERVEGNRIILGGLVREMQAESSEPLFSAVLSGEDVTRSLNDPDRLQSIGERMNGIMADIRSSQEQTVQEQQDLERMKQAHEAALGDKLEEKQSLASDQQETQADLAEQSKIVARLEKEIKELQSDLSKLTGKSYNAKDIREAVEFASNGTGVPEGVLYGFLKMETNLGANTGQCTYAEVEKVAVARYKKYGSKYKASIALLYKRKEIFYGIVDDLGYSKDKKVSCSPSGYIGQGGAMGVSQFMSDVWKGYESQISSKTGNKKPDPWGLTDGVMAMALKLKKAGATSSKESAIKSASISYLGGFNANYYNGIVYWSKNYKLLFK
jgi:peptidoglycan hydrolase CwlO-like protein